MIRPTEHSHTLSMEDRKKEEQVPSSYDLFPTTSKAVSFLSYLRKYRITGFLAH